jgi:hypothetical protein
MDKENKWHNVSFDSATYSICKVMAGAKGQSTASYMRDLVLLALHGEYADQLRVTQRQLLKACGSKPDSRLAQQRPAQASDAPSAVRTQIEQDLEDRSPA